MGFFGRLIGFFVGSMFAGFPGAILGFVIGSFFDSASAPRAREQQRQWGGFSGFNPGAFGRAGMDSGGLQGLFFDTTFAVMGYVAKSDGRISEDEIAKAEQIMARLSLSGERRRQAIDQFSLGKSIGFDVDSALNAFKRACWLQPSLLKLFLEIQVEVAMVRGSLSGAKRAALRYVFQVCGVSGNVFDQFERQSHAGQNYRQYARNEQRADPRTQLKEAYSLLEVEAAATDADVKKAYRRMMSKNHPDRMMAKGVPPEMIKLATQKTQQVKEAYEFIKQARGLT